MEITKEINLNINQPNNFQLINVMQGTLDSIKVIVHLYDGNKPYKIPDTVDQYQILGILPSGKYVIDDQVTQYDDTSVTFVINQNMMAKAGYVKFSISLVDSADQSIAETFPAKIMVTAIPGQDYEQTDEIPIITKSLQEVKEGAEIAVNAANKSEEYYNKLISEKGQPNGIATLDENTKVPLDELYEATTTSKGITQLEDSITSTSTSTAATPNSVKTVNDALTEEISRATTAESTLSQSLNTEITRATTAENDLKTIIDTNKPIWDDKYTKNEVDNKFSALETNIDWKEAVATYDDIITTYPTPDDGWTVNVKDTDYTYRYNGTEWITISANAIPKATQSIDGLQSKEDKTKLDNIATGAEVNQNAFSNLTIDTTTITADSKTDTLTLFAGDNILLTPDVINDTVTISSMHPKITISTDTTSTATPSAGETFTAIDSITRDTNGHVTKVNTKTVTLPNTSITVDNALSSSSINPVQNKVISDALNTKLSLSGGTMTGDVILKNRLVINDGVTSRAIVYAYDDGDSANYGSEVVIFGAGNMFIGGGESPTGLRTALQSAVETGEIYTQTGENIYITSDSNIYLYSGTSNDGATRTGIVYDSSGALRPLVNNTRTLGSSTIHWANIYANTFTGNLSGTASTSTHIAITTSNPTSASTYYIPFTSSIGSAAVSLLGNNGLRVQTLEGTSTAEGYDRLYLGNTTATGTAANKSGGLVMYGTTSYYTLFKPYNVPASSLRYLVGTSSSAAIGSSAKPVYVSSTGLITACTISTTPTSGSANLITSGGVYTALSWTSIASNATSYSGDLSTYNEIRIIVKCGNTVYRYGFNLLGTEITSATQQYIEGYDNGSYTGVASLNISTSGITFGQCRVGNIDYTGYLTIYVR